MNGIVDEALGCWGLSGAHYRLIAARENAVYEVTQNTQRAALRLHRKGYRSDAELRAELDWMSAVSTGGLSVPNPIPALDGAVLHHVRGTQVDVLSWLDGQTLTDVLPTLDFSAREQLFSGLGTAMAQLHTVSDQWDAPAGFVRAHWDQDGLVGDAPLWDRFWENPALSAHDHDLFQTFRDVAFRRLSQIGPTLDYGLIHADLIPENVLVDGHNLHLIDFDDGGFGFRVFDVATALFKHRARDDFADLQTALLDGYRAVRPLDLTELDLLMAVRAATYVGWNISRLNEDGGTDRNTRFIETCRSLAKDYLSRHR